MRRRSALIAVPALMLSAAGCGSSKTATPSSASPTTPSASAPPVKIVAGPVPPVTAGTAFGQKPTVAKGTGTPSPDLAVETAIQGSGPVIAKGDYLQANYLGQIWDTGKVFDNSYDRGTPLLVQIGTGQVIPGWDAGLIGKNGGSRVEMAVPPAQGYGPSGNPQAGITGTDTLVFVIDVIDVFGPTSSAHGTEVPQTDVSLPKVGVNTDGKAAAITVPKVKPPTDLVSRYIIEGSGPVVKSSGTLLLQYEGVLWDSGKEFDSSYQHSQLALFPLARLIKGWQEGLVGKKVGSRVLLVVPPSLGYGAQGQPPTIPGDATLVFALDIIATS